MNYMKMNYLKLMPGRTLTHASRNRRELSAAAEVGYQVSVISYDTPAEFCASYPIYQLISDEMAKLDYSIPQIKRYCRIIRNKLRVIRIARMQRADIISCHDLDSLFDGWASNLFRMHSKKAKLIYDSHEFEIGRKTKRNKLQIWWITHLERFLIKRCAFSVVVNDAIANEVQRIHKLKRRPIVVRSTPNLWHVDETATQQMHAEFCRQLGIPKNSFIVMYHGGVLSGRGIETLIQLISVNPNICAVILGNGEAGYMDSLMKLADSTGVEKRIIFHPAVPIEELWKYVGAADVGMITIPAVVKSYYYMLPNKFFENIQSETPVICSDFPAIKPIVDHYQIGLTCDPENLDKINACVERMRTDKAFYAQCKEKLKRAKQEFSWEKEKNVLMEELKGLDKNAS